MKVLITGISGFVGSHLADLVSSDKNMKVYGLCRKGSFGDSFAYPGKRVQLEKCDLSDASGVLDIFKKIKPDRVFHLAGQSYPAGSWDAPGRTLRENILGGLHVLEAVRKASPRSRVLIVGSSEEYGRCEKTSGPIREDAFLGSESPYGISKQALGFLAAQYEKNFKIHAVRTRSFNHTGPGQKEIFVVSDFAKQIARIEAGLAPPVIQVGDLDASRDFTDVRDVIRAYRLLLEKGKPGAVYNVCSGSTVKIRRLLSFYLAKSFVKIRIHRDRRRLRPNDFAGFAGDNSLLRKRTGWKPVIPLEQTLSDLLEYWRNKIGLSRTPTQRKN